VLVTDTILQFISQFIGGGALLCFSAWLTIHDVVDLATVGASRLPMIKPLLKTLAHVALSLVAAACMLDPLIPGFACLTVKVPTDPSTYPTLLENLRVRVVPLSFRGQAGGDRISNAAFGRDGSAEVTPDLALLETRVMIEVFDETRPSEPIKSATVYISPFVRRQLICKTITL
jgi:hypothetical protein